MSRAGRLTRETFAHSQAEKQRLERELAQMEHMCRPFYETENVGASRITIDFPRMQYEEFRSIGPMGWVWWNAPQSQDEAGVQESFERMAQARLRTKDLKIEQNKLTNQLLQKHE